MCCQISVGQPLWGNTAIKATGITAGNSTESNCTAGSTAVDTANNMQLPDAETSGAGSSIGQQPGNLPNSSTQSVTTGAAVRRSQVLNETAENGVGTHARSSAVAALAGVAAVMLLQLL